MCWHVTQQTTAMLPCSLQHFQAFRQLRNKLRTDRLANGQILVKDIFFFSLFFFFFFWGGGGGGLHWNIFWCLQQRRDKAKRHLYFFLEITVTSHVLLPGGLYFMPIQFSVRYSGPNKLSHSSQNTFNCVKSILGIRADSMCTWHAVYQRYIFDRIKWSVCMTADYTPSWILKQITT